MTIIIKVSCFLSILYIEFFCYQFNLFTLKDDTYMVQYVLHTSRKTFVARPGIMLSFSAYNFYLQSTIMPKLSFSESRDPQLQNDVIYEIFPHIFHEHLSIIKLHFVINKSQNRHLQLVKSKLCGSFIECIYSFFQKFKVNMLKKVAYQKICR